MKDLSKSRKCLLWFFVLRSNFSKLAGCRVWQVDTVTRKSCPLKFARNARLLIIPLLYSTLRKCLVILITARAPAVSISSRISLVFSNVAKEEHYVFRFANLLAAINWSKVAAGCLQCLRPKCSTRRATCENHREDIFRVHIIVYSSQSANSRNRRAKFVDDLTVAVRPCSFRCEVTHSPLDVTQGARTVLYAEGDHGA